MSWRRSTSRCSSGAASTSATAGCAPCSRRAREDREARSRRGLGAPAVLEQAELHQTLGGGDDRLLVRAGRPAEQATGLAAGGVLRLAELGDDLLDRRIAQPCQADQEVRELQRRHAPGRWTEPALQDPG